MVSVTSPAISRTALSDRWRQPLLALLLTPALLIAIDGHRNAQAAPLLSFQASSSATAGFSFREPNLIISDDAVQVSHSASSKPGVTSFDVTAAAPEVKKVQTLKDPADDPSLQVVQTWDTKASASATGSVGFGSLHAVLSAQTQVDFLATLEGFKPDPKDPAHQIPFSKTFISPIGAEAIAGVHETMSDFLMVVPDAKHPADSLAPVRVTLSLHGSGSAPSVKELGQSFSGAASVQVTSSFNFHNTENRNAVVSDIDQRVDGVLAIDETGTVNVPVGLEFPITLDLRAQVGAGGVFEGAGCNFICSVEPGESAQLDIGNTVNFFVDPLSDFTITSFSGHDYGTPVSNVPEPPSLPLLAAGIIVLMILRRPARQWSNPEAAASPCGGSVWA